MRFFSIYTAKQINKNQIRITHGTKTEREWPSPTGDGWCNFPMTFSVSHIKPQWTFNFAEQGRASPIQEGPQRYPVWGDDCPTVRPHRIAFVVCWTVPVDISSDASNNRRVRGTSFVRKRFRFSQIGPCIIVATTQGQECASGPEGFEVPKRSPNRSIDGLCRFCDTNQKVWSGRIPSVSDSYTVVWTLVWWRLQRRTDQSIETETNTPISVRTTTHKVHKEAEFHLLRRYYFVPRPVGLVPLSEFSLLQCIQELGVRVILPS